MKILISLSGGLDSATLLGYFSNNGASITAVSFYYGSKHNKYENQAAKTLAGYYKVKLLEIDISQAMAGIKSNLLLDGGDIPEGHYKADNMKQTVVPARNMIFISILAGIAASRKIDSIGLGIHAGDHAIYPDCREDFIRPMAQAVYAATDGVVQDIHTPFLFMSKFQIVNIGMNSFQVPVPYSFTRTCYKDQEVACGKCGSCVERLDAFQLNDLEDPIIYESRG